MAFSDKQAERLQQHEIHGREILMGVFQAEEHGPDGRSWDRKEGRGMETAHGGKGGGKRAVE